MSITTEDTLITTELMLRDLDGAVHSLFADLCDRECCVGLVRFLDVHPNSFHSGEDIAYYVGKPWTDVKCGLDALIERGLVCELKAADATFFGATSDPVRRRLIRELCAWQDRWQARLAHLGMFVSGGTRPNLRRDPALDGDYDVCGSSDA